MEKYIIDKKTGLEYELKDDIYYPTGRISKSGTLPPPEPTTDDEPKEKPIGVWGMWHKDFIRETV